MSARESNDAASPMQFVSWRRSLLGVPLRNEAAGVVDEGDGLRVSVARKRPWWLVPPISYVIKPRAEKTMRLDALGTEVWRLCDGERTVERVIDEFAASHRLTFHESRAAVTTYIKRLVERGALVIAAEGEGEGEEKEKSKEE